MTATTLYKELVFYSKGLLRLFQLVHISCIYSLKRLYIFPNFQKNSDELRDKWFQHATVQELREATVAHACAFSPHFLFTRDLGTKVINVIKPCSGLESSEKVTAPSSFMFLCVRLYAGKML